MVVFGAGEAGSQPVSVPCTDPNSPYVPVALLDGDPNKTRLRVRASGARDDLAAAGGRHRASTVILAIPSADSAQVRELHELATATSLKVKVLPPVTLLLDVPVTADDLQPVTEADLLVRHMTDTDVESIAGYLRRRRVLVTGAGGSIGSELCRQIVPFEPASLVMLDRDESGLHQVQLSIHGRAMLDSRSLVVCDIRDPEAPAAAYAEHLPEVVFHAQAPTPLRDVASGGGQDERHRHTQRGTGRSGNRGDTLRQRLDRQGGPAVLRPWVLPAPGRATHGQHRRGGYRHLPQRPLRERHRHPRVGADSLPCPGSLRGPVTVTDPEVTRCFMTVEEAAQLVIQAGATAGSGEVLVLDLGKPVRITEVAERLIDEAGGGISIVYTGLRPAEKLHEDLFGEGEKDLHLAHHLISHGNAPPINSMTISVLMKETPNSPAQVIQALQQQCNSLAPDAVAAK